MNKASFKKWYFTNLPKLMKLLLLFFLLDIGLSWLTSLQFIQYHVAGF